MKLMAWIAFPGDGDESDPDGAEIALRRAGFTVARMPGRFRSRLAVPGDDFIMAMMDGVDNDKIDNAATDEIDAIVNGYGGLCAEFDSVPSDYVLDFDEWFELGKHPVYRH